ncbi:replication factor-a protein [Martensiomyces pterosporus]|nr:replication factor-a protein [Martensiomyces pterosporus]
MSRVDDVKPGFSAGGAQAPVRTGPAPALHPIRDLNPYHNKWTIRARVSQKSGIKTWNKPNSQGRLFSVNLIDESGEIRATAFTQQVDQFYPILEVGKVYYLSNARVTVAKKNFSNVNNEYELIFDGATEVQQCLEQAELPQMHFDFIALSRLMSFEKGHVVDILGVVRNVSEATEITSRNNPDSKMTKRELTVVDKSGYQVRTTLWGDDALSFSASGEPVIAFKGVRVGDFGGRTLSLPSSGTMMVNPDIPEAHALRGWYDAEGRNASYQSYGGGAQGAGERGEKYESQLKTMAQVRDENIGMGDAAEYFYLKGTIVFIRNTTIAYPSCPAESCNKKVVEDQTTGQWRCEKCERSYPAPEYRYIFSINVSDETGQNWLQCFNDIGEQLLGCSANDMVNWQQNNEALFNKKLEEATFKQQKFRCRAKSETFNDTTRVRISVMAAYPIDFVTEAKRLSRLIESYA